MDLDRFTRFDWYSMSAVPIEMYFGEQPLSTGTAFFWEEDDQLYLATAWHCFSGRHFQTKSHLSKTLAEPDRIKVWWNLDRQPIGHKGTSFVHAKDEDGKPLWLIHPIKGSDVDVAMLPVRCPERVVPYPINKLPSDWFGFFVGQDIFILGFPLGIEGLRLPIWKRASLATEWQIPTEVQPYWLVDTASRPGMSGSPVLQRAYPYEPEFHGMRSYGKNGRSRFVGVYSGRLATENEKDMQLGLVWHELYIHDIVRGQRRDGEPPVHSAEAVAPD